MEQEDLIEELYNQVIQEHSDLQYEYTEDELQDVIMDIVYKKLDELQSYHGINWIIYKNHTWTQDTITHK